MLELGSSEGNPKDLRLALNMALCDSAALAHLLIDKGIITLTEYERAITDEANREVDRYEAKLAEHGLPVKLR